MSQLLTAISVVVTTATTVLTAAVEHVNVLAAVVLRVNFAGTNFWNELTQGGHQVFGVACIFVGLAALLTRRLSVLVVGIICLGLASIPVFNPAGVQDVGSSILQAFQG